MWWLHVMMEASVNWCSRKPKETKECWQLSEARGETEIFPPSHQKQPALLTPWFWTSGLKNCRRIMFRCFQSLRQKQNWPSCLPAIMHRDTLCSCALGFDLKVFFNMESPEAVCLCPLAPRRLPILPWQAQYSFHRGLRVPSFEEAHSWLWLKKSSEGAEWAHTGSPVWAGTSLNRDAWQSRWRPLGVWGVSGQVTCQRRRTN